MRNLSRLMLGKTRFGVEQLALGFGTSRRKIKKMLRHGAPMCDVINGIRATEAIADVSEHGMVIRTFVIRAYSSSTNAVAFRVPDNKVQTRHLAKPRNNREANEENTGNIWFGSIDRQWSDIRCRFDVPCITRFPMDHIRANGNAAMVIAHRHVAKDWDGFAQHSVIDVSHLMGSANALPHSMFDILREDREAMSPHL